MVADATGVVRRFLRLDLLGAAAGAALVVVVNLVAVQSGLLWIIPVALIVQIACLLVADRIVGDGRVAPALWVIACANWLLAIVVPVALPFLWPIMVLVVLVPIVLAAPHVRLGTMIGMLASGAVVAATSSLIGLDGDDGGAIPDIADELELGVTIGALTALMIPISLVVWQNNRAQQRALETVRATNRQLELSREALASSRRRIAGAGDAARRRIERDLHDGAQQRLVALGMKMRLLESRLAAGASDDAGAFVAELVGDVDATVDELRELAHGIYPPVLEAHGLAEAFEAVARRSPQRVTVNGSSAVDPRPGREVEETLYFAGLEALANCAKHAPDAAVDVTIERTPSGVEIAVRDDGPGFDLETVPSSQGLANMRDRIEVAGGTLTVESQDGVGTVVSALIPD